MLRRMTTDNQNRRYTMWPDRDPVEAGLMVLGVVVLVAVFLTKGLLFSTGAAAESRSGLSPEPMPGVSPRMLEERAAEDDDRSDQMAEDAECPPLSHARAWA